jgi:hypothetical protein
VTLGRILPKVGGSEQIAKMAGVRMARVKDYHAVQTSQRTATLPFRRVTTLRPIDQYLLLTLVGPVAIFPPLFSP